MDKVIHLDKNVNIDSIEITPYFYSNNGVRVDLEKFNLLLKYHEPMTIICGSEVVRKQDFVQPWMIDWKRMPALGNTASIILIEGMIRDFVMIYLLKKYPSDEYHIMDINDLYAFCMQYSNYISDLSK